MSYEPHPAADLFPLLGDRELRELADDIRANGLIERVVLCDGKVLDGRNRIAACEIAGVKVRTVEWSGEAETPVRFVIAHNLKRRHLTTSQRDAVAVEALPLLEKEARKRQREAGRKSAPGRPAQKVSPKLGEVSSGGKATVAAAALVNVGKSGVEKAKRIKQEDPEAFERIKAGKVTVGRAYKDLQRKERADAEQAAIKSADRSRFTIRIGEVGNLDWIEDGSVDLIVTDPPYPKEHLALYSSLSKTAARVLKPGGSCFVMVGQSYLPELMARLGERLTYQWTIAYLTPGGQSVQLWERKVNTFWKPVLWFVKGEYSGRWVGDVRRSDPNDNDKRFHHWGQSESGMADLIRSLSEPADLICDPFVGGGTTAVVALDLGRRFVGADIDASSVKKTLARLGASGDAA